MTHLCPTHHRATSDAHGTRPWLEADGLSAIEFRQVLPGLIFRNPRMNGMLAFCLQADDATAAAR